MKLRAIHQPRNHLTHIVLFTHVVVNDAVDLFGGIEWCHRRLTIELAKFAMVEIGNDVAGELQCMLVVVGEVIGNAGDLAVHVATAQRFGIDDLTGGRLHQGWTTEKDGALTADDDRLVSHRRHIGTTRSA